MNTPQSHRDTELEAISGLTRRIIGARSKCTKFLDRAARIHLRSRAVHRARRSRHQFSGRSESPRTYKGRPLGTIEVDLIVEDLVVVEIKSVDAAHPVFEAQLLTYLR